MPVATTTTTTTTTTTAGPSGGLRRHASAFNLRDPRNKPLPPAPIVDSGPARPDNATAADPFPALLLAHDLVLPLLPALNDGGTTSTVLHHTGSRPRSRSDPRPFSSYMIARDALDQQQSTKHPVLALPQLAPRPNGRPVPAHDPRVPSPPNPAGSATLIRLPPGRLASVRRADRPNTPASLASRASLQRSQSTTLHLPRVAPRTDPVVRRTSPVVEPRAVVPLHLAHLARTEPRSRPRRDNSVRLHGPATAPRPTLALPQLAGPAPPPSALLARPAEPDQLAAEPVDDDDASGFYDTASVTRIVRSALRDPAPPYRDPAAPYLPDLDPQTGRPLTTAALTLTPELTQAVLALMQGHYIPSLRAAPGSSSTASSSTAVAAPAPPMTSWTTAAGAIGRAPAGSTSTMTTTTTAPLATLSAWTVLGNARAGAENTRAYLCYGGIHVATLAVLPPISSTDEAPGVVIALTPRLPLADLDPGSMPRNADTNLHGNLVLYLVSENRTVTMTAKDRGYAAQILEFVGTRPSAAPPLPDRHRESAPPLCAIAWERAAGAAVLARPCWRGRRQQCARRGRAAFMGAVPDRTASLDLSAAAAAAAAALSGSALGSAPASLAPMSPGMPLTPTGAGDTTLHRMPHDQTGSERGLPELPAADVPDVEDDEDGNIDNRSLRSTATVDSGSRVSSTLYHAPLGGALVGSDVALVAVVRDAMVAESLVGIEVELVDREEDAASSVAGVFGSEIMAARAREAVGSPEVRVREMLV
ncbi:hypothetical protein AMAG_05900 [Allomyces macrogynus ATCC 38327]|uniref:Uncharacterized protein n=1 Tax=Allomyces macrogynus (strain ATCC 38327) TaxID=578462 RepID=A0A0L0SDG1_ALLM3|nr:hypothetical protein AMAG_05900 [Allomyces macrogynus ATCC 38327]|eukprot:KNE60516.1 hypothetical protein AMAG_05900 [Allomyces macrogynus ATCC 38327]